MAILSKPLSRLARTAAIAAAVAGYSTPQAQAGANPLLGEVMLVGYNFCPRGWTDASGQLLPISQYSALFSLYGTMYGGDGRTTFALPDLRGRSPIHTGQGAGLPNYVQGSRGGAVSFTLTVNQMPSHNHNVQAAAQRSNKGGPGNDFLGIPEHYNPNSQDDDISIYHDGPPDTIMDTRMITNTGGNQAVSHRGPYTTMRWCVALQGIFPSRN